MSDTIAAIASGAGNAAIGVIRVSGDDCLSIAGGIFRDFRGSRIRLEDLAPGTVKHGWICDGSQTVDEVLLILFRGPHSYTGEDAVEINCHGGSFVMGRVMELLVRSGARLANPGEFTRRAFLKGKMDLSEAEAVMDVISSGNRLALANSIRQLKGSLGKKMKSIREELLYQTAYIESALDDPEHLSLDGFPEKLKDSVLRIKGEIADLIDGFRQGRILREGIRVVLSGKPNAGKSSLLNAILEMQRAIVTDVPGTTRDVLEESYQLDGLPLRLIDTAGLRPTDEEVEKIGVSIAKKQAREADLLLYIIDSAKETDPGDRKELLQLFDEDGGNIPKGIFVLNKEDLAEKTGPSDVRAVLDPEGLFSDWPVIPVSAKDGTGLAELKEAMRESIRTGDLIDGMSSEREFITNLRHRDLLVRTNIHLDRVLESIDAGLPEDFFTIDLMAACEELGTVTGETARDDLIDEIFRRFCTGK